MIYADIGIGPTGNLNSTAQILSEILHVKFEEDTEGRYDEFPAYIADFEGVRYALLGTPDPEDDLRDQPSNEFQLMIRPIYINNSLKKQDSSSEIAKKISKDGRIYCWILK